MKKGTPGLAIPVFRLRVAPVLNWCSSVYVYPEDAGEGVPGQEVVFVNMNAFDLLRILHEKGVQTLICGALSPNLLSYGEDLGLRIIHGIAGEIEDVLRAYRARELNQPCFWIPGCRGLRRYRKAWPKGCGAGVGDEENPAPPDTCEPGKLGVGAYNGSEETRAGNPGSGPGGFCVCPRCGIKVRHKRGIPCTQIVCPDCAQPMVRA